MNNVVAEFRSFMGLRNLAPASPEDGKSRLSSSSKGRTERHAANPAAGADVCTSDDSGDVASDDSTVGMFLPTQKVLLAVGRQDLVYALQIHGHEAIARRCERERVILSLLLEGKSCFVFLACCRCGVRVETRGLSKRRKRVMMFG